MSRHHKKSRRHRWRVEDLLQKGLIDPTSATDMCAAPPGTAENQGLSSKGRGRSDRRDIEAEEQAQLIAIYRAAYPDYSRHLIHIPNGGYRSNAYEGWRLKQQGVQAGVSDLLLAVPTALYPGMWIEFKAAPPNDSPVTESQKDWLELMLEQGYQAHLARGVREAMDLISTYLEGAGK